MKNKALMSVLLGVVLIGAPVTAAQTEPIQPEPSQPETVPTEPPLVEEPATDAELPPAEEILNRFIEVIGGKEKMKEIKSLRIDGRYSGRPFKFAARLTLWKEHPNQFHLKIAEPAGETIEMAFDKGDGWERQPGLGARPIEGLRLIEMKDTADFWGEANWEERYVSTQTVGEIANFNGERAYVVHVNAVSGREKMLVFSVESGLYVGTRTLTVHPDTGEPAEYESVLGPYKEFGGVKMPMGMTQRWVNGADSVKIEYTSIEVNPEEKHDFGPPDDLQELPADEGGSKGG